MNELPFLIEQSRENEESNSEFITKCGKPRTTDD